VGEGGHIKGTYKSTRKEKKEYRGKERKKKKVIINHIYDAVQESQRLSEWTIDDTKSAIARKNPWKERDLTASNDEKRAMKGMRGGEIHK
jgi:hypothetical protein